MMVGRKRVERIRVCVRHEQKTNTALAEGCQQTGHSNGAPVGHTQLSFLDEWALDG